MSDEPELLPILPADRQLRLTPTDVTQFVRLEQCERYLRFRLAERAQQKFMEPYDVAPQRITPLLSLSGRSFEMRVEEEVARQARTVHYATLAGHSHSRAADNQEVVNGARSLAAGEDVILLQPRLETRLMGWGLRGDLDLVKLQRRDDGALRALIVDLKSTTRVKVEHRLQVAMYRLMLEQILSEGGVAHEPIELGILFRPPVDPAPAEQKQVESGWQAAGSVFGLQNALLEIVKEPGAYLRSAHDLVLGPDSIAHRVARTPFEELPFCLSSKCDSCLYNEFCLRWSARHDDLSLLPHMTSTNKAALRRGGITTIRDLATLKSFAPGPGSPHSRTLEPTPGREGQVKRLGTTWPVGSRLDELIHRARSFRRFVRKEELDVVQEIPGHGNSSLPACRPDLNPNLIQIYVDAQHDYLEDRIYLLGAHVVANGNGEPVGSRTVIRSTDGPPDSQAKEQQLLVVWTRDLVQAVVDLAVSGDPGNPRKSAPIHIVFFDRPEQQLLLKALARNFPPIFQAAPPLYDFLTQVAAFDSPIATYLDEEIRETKNFPITCQNLQSVATYLKFDWNRPYPFRELFQARMFDYLGKIDVAGQPEWFTRRARFASSIPLEYAYGAWGTLPTPGPGQHDEFADFRRVSVDLLRAFQKRRLEAMEHITASVRTNPNTEKTPFLLPDLANYEDRAPDLAHALDEFVKIERFVTLSDWRAIRHAAPERRVLMGETLLARYHQADQDPSQAERNRENQQRYRMKLEFEAAQREQNPGSKVQLTSEQKEECKFSNAGLRLRLRLDCQGIDCDLHEALLLSNLRVGDHVVLVPRWTTDERRPEGLQTRFTPTPKQMLYGQRAELLRIEETETDESGRVVAASVELELKQSFGNKSTQPYVFFAFERPLLDGELYTLDPCPDEWMTFWCARVVKGLCQGQPNVLLDRLEHPVVSEDDAGSSGQVEFLEGLDAFRDAGHLHDFEEGKRTLIGGHGRTPILLVQGPPGTGKSYSTAFAIFARLQAAFREGRPYRVFLSCKTHAATDVLLENVLRVRGLLRELNGKDPALFQRHFEPRLLEIPLSRFDPKDPTPDGIVSIPKDEEKSEGDPTAFDTILGQNWTVVGFTPGGIYSLVKKRRPPIFGHHLCNLLVLDEASQLSLPEAVMAALPMAPSAQLIVVGDHRQLPPIVKHDWDREVRRTFQKHRVYESLFDTLRSLPTPPPMIQYTESFRLHAVMADFLREEIYRHDGIPYHATGQGRLPEHPIEDELVAAVLAPDYPLIVVCHEEASSQVRNPFEQAIIEPILRTLTDPARYGLDAVDGVGVVVPHRAQRAALQQALPELRILDPTSGRPNRSAIDTVERFQGGERTVILVGATESDRSYLLSSSDFLLDPRRLTVALSRAKRKMILVASASLFSVFSPEEETFAHSQLWKNLLHRTCTTSLWQGERQGTRVSVWGCHEKPGDQGSR